MGAALSQLIPIRELAPGAAGAVRNQVIAALVAQAAREMNLPIEKLVVRDLRPVEDLTMYATGTTASTINDWIFLTAATTVTGFITVASTTMADQRYVAIYGVKDLRESYEVKQAGATYRAVLSQVVSLVKINVGGADKVIWDLCKLQAYFNELVGVSPAAVVIPQNAVFTISYYKANGVASVISNIVLEGVVVEPRGKLVSP